MPEVKIVGMTKPVDGMTPEEFIVYCARVSNPSNQNNHATAGKLLKYLVEHQHWSPFEMVSITMEIVTTRDIARQILRHRSFSFQEFSQRYAVADASIILREARMQDAKNRQNSLACTDKELSAWWDERQAALFEYAQRVYEQALSEGIAKEVARAVLPEGLTESRLYMAGTLRSWIHYCELRSGEETQKEHRDVALLCAKELMRVFPSLWGE